MIPSTSRHRLGVVKYTVAEMVKRLFDIAGSVAGVIVFAPVLAAVSAAILLEDGRPLLFAQPRLGRGRRPFTILKFRSMRDGRITRVGRLLRATGLDELPQFINIMRGDMSAVGPRPLTGEDVARLGWLAPRHDFRWRVAPGLTGLAQMLGPASAIGSLSLDRCYVSRGTLLLDLRLVAYSFVVNVLGKARARRLLIGSGLLPRRLLHHWIDRTMVRGQQTSAI
jgi:lipopolysaccharide/colanic/teichoic acid biosynthesis glycosyltransferase